MTPEFAQNELSNAIALKQDKRKIKQENKTIPCLQVFFYDEASFDL